MKNNSKAARGAGCLVAAFFLLGCFEWHRGLTVGDVTFEKARLDRSGVIIGTVKENTTIGGRECRAGWVHVYTNGVPSAFTTAAPIVLNAETTLPAGTWVTQNSTGAVRVCALPNDTPIQGHVCRGSGDPAGVQTAFYPSGALKQYFLRKDTSIQGVPCKAGLLKESIELHENGALKACVLSDSFTRGGVVIPKGERIFFDAGGALIR